MNKTTEALKLAEEALKMYCEHGAIFKPNETLAAIREALAEPVKQEPVAKVTVRPFNPMDASCPTTEVKWLMKPVSGFLYAAPVDAKAIRAEALEEAAKVCDGWPDYDVDGLAEVIRGLTKSNTGE